MQSEMHGKICRNITARMTSIRFYYIYLKEIILLIIYLWCVLSFQVLKFLGLDDNHSPLGLWIGHTPTYTAGADPEVFQTGMGLRRKCGEKGSMRGCNFRDPLQGPPTYSVHGRKTCVYPYLCILFQFGVIPEIRRLLS